MGAVLRPDALSRNCRCRQEEWRALNVCKHEMASGFVEYLEARSPKPECLRLFREIVLDVWRESERATLTTRCTLQDRLDALRAKKDRVVDAFVHE